MSQHIQNTSHQDQNRRMLTETTSAQEEQRAYGQAMWALALNVRGELILPGDPAYEAARRVWNGASDRHPALIVRCADVEDVIAAITFAREQGMAVSVRSGGHSMAGYGTNDGGMVIDLSDMKAIAIDPTPACAWGSTLGQPDGRRLCPERCSLHHEYRSGVEC